MYGGVSQIRDDILRAGMEVVVGTPGRLIDTINRGKLPLNSVRTMIIDEVHAMLDVDFLESMRFLYDKVKKASTIPIQTIMLSATLPSNLRETIKDVCGGEYDLIDLTKDLRNRTPASVKHYALHIPTADRSTALEAPMQKFVGTKGKVIVFTQRKRDVMDLKSTPSLRDAQTLHGDMSQYSREAAFKLFKSGRATRLVATNVAARGLDIPSVDLVLQLEPPETPDIYIHRAGRTARVGASGTVISMWDTPQEIRVLAEIEAKAGVKFEKLELSADRTQVTPTGQIEDFSQLLKGTRDTHSYRGHSGRPQGRYTPRARSFSQPREQQDFHRDDQPFERAPSKQDNFED